MNKVQILILLLIIALAFYYLNEEQPKTPPSLTKKLPKPQPPKPTINLPPTKIEELLNQGWPAHFPAAQWVEEPKPDWEPPKIKGLNPPHSQLDEPFELPEISEPTIKFPSDEFIPENDFLNEDLNETYRHRCLTFLNDFTATPLTIQATDTLQVKDRPLSEYFQALWNLKGLPKFPETLAQPLREWINLTTEIKPPNYPIDYGWLTDDNLEFILLNYQPIQSTLTKTKLFRLRTDIANIYNSFQKSQTNQDWDLPEFLQTLELNKAPYTLFPLRVSGNHWGLFILHNLTWQELTPTYQVYYTSSGGTDLESEKQQLQPFINQICGETEIQTLLPSDRKSKGYNCGVYLVFYLQEILEKKKLELTRYHSAEDCQQFRWEWKERIGAKWCQLT